jgi:hypothetical protein
MKKIKFCIFRHKIGKSDIEYHEYMMKNGKFLIVRSNSQTKTYEFLTKNETFGSRNNARVFKTSVEANRVADCYKKSNTNSAIKYTVITQIYP